MAVASAQQINRSKHVQAIIAKQAETAINRSNSKTRSLMTFNHANAMNRPIADTLALPNMSNPSYYIFNYMGGGYLILAADKRVEPILAFSNTGHFKYSLKLNSGLVDWLTVNA